MGVAPTRYVAAGTLHRHHTLTQDYSRMGLDLEGLQAVPLCLGKAINLFIGKTNVGFD